MKLRIMIPLLGLVMCMFAVTVTAAPVNLTTRGNYGGKVNISYQLNSGEWRTKNTYAGNFGSIAGRKGANKGAILDGMKLTAAYCIDLFHSISTGGSYTANVTRNGVISDRGAIRNAGQIAWLMTNKAYTATDLNKQAGLQAAIWKQVYGNKFELLSTGAVKTAYDGYIAALGNNIAPVSNLFWIDPHSGTNLSKSNQDLVALATPIPAAVWLFGTGIIGLIGSSKRKKKTNIL